MMFFPLSKNILVGILLFVCIAITSAQTQMQMNDEAQANYIKADKNLNSIYREILAEYKADTGFIKNLKISQNIWIKFRDAEVKVKYPDNGSYGSIHPMCVSMYLESLTLDRTKTLVGWIDGIEEGDVCAGSVKLKPITAAKTPGHKTPDCNLVSPQTKTKLLSLSGSMNKPNSAESFIADFKNLKGLKVKLNKEIRAINTNSITPHIDTCLKELERLIPFLKQTDDEEGTVIFFTLNNETLTNKAKETKGDMDDNFFSFLEYVYGSTGEDMISSAVWKTKASHLSEFSNLGDGDHTNTLKKLVLLNKEQNAYVKESLNKIYDLLIDDLASSQSFGNSREKVLKELRSIIADRSLEIKNTDREKLIGTEKKLQTEKFQFECKTKKCNFE